MVSDLRENFVRSLLTRVDGETLDQVRDIVAALRLEAEDWFTREEVSPDRRRMLVSLDMRYVGQNYELSVELDEAAIAAPTVESLEAGFFAAHDRAYGYHNPDDPVEIVNFRLTALGQLPRPEPAGTHSSSETAPAPVARRRVYFDGDSPVETAIYNRADLASGHRLQGPAVIEQLDATTLLFPDDRLSVDSAGNLVVEIAL